MGKTLSASTSGIDDYDGMTNVAYDYQWVHSDGDIDADIDGATSATYTLVSADEGKMIKVRVSFTDDSGNEETLTSLATAEVAPRPDNQADEEVPKWSADMLVVEYTSSSIGAASADLFSNIGGSVDLQAIWLWHFAPDRQPYLAFTEAIPGDDELTLQVGDLTLAFPAGSSAESNFTWTEVDVDWEDGQTIGVRIVRSAVAAPK